MKKKVVGKSPPEHDATEEFELALHPTEKGNYVLRLYVSGMTPNSLKAIAYKETKSRWAVTGVGEVHSTVRGHGTT